MDDVTSYFGELVFNDEEMRSRLPKDVYRQLKKTVGEGKDLDLNIANSRYGRLRTEQPITHTGSSR